MVEITGVILCETKLAVQIDDGDTVVWIPKSLIETRYEDEDGLDVIEIPEWLAIKKELI